MKRFVVVGLGIFGSKIAEHLHSLGHEVVAVDITPDRVDQIARSVTSAVVGDARNREVLEKIGARGADAAVVSTGDDLGASVLVVLALKDTGVQNIFVKVISNDHARIMGRLGATEIVFPEQESAINLAPRMLRSGALLNYVRLGGGLSLQEMAVPSTWEGKTLRQLALPSRHRVSVVAVRDVVQDRMIPVPDPDMPLLDVHTLVMTGTDENLARIAAIE